MTELNFNIDESAEQFNAGKELPPVGWGKFTIITAENSKEYQSLIISFENENGCKVDVWCRYALGNNSEQWMVDNGIATIAKIAKCSGMTGGFTMNDVPKLFGRSVDMKIIHKKSKKVNDQGEPFINANAKDFATAGENSSNAAIPSSQPESKPNSDW